jgi:hypothetical protein
VAKAKKQTIRGRRQDRARIATRAFALRLGASGRGEVSLEPVTRNVLVEKQDRQGDE